MRVAALSDIHGNLPALEAVLEDVERESVDAVVVVGDVVLGPWPVETFDAVARLDAHIVRGNADHAAFDPGARKRSGRLANRCAELLGPQRLAALAAWPLTTRLVVEGLGRTLVCHSTPTSDEPIYTPITPEEELVELLRPVDADALLCGHTHIQYDRRLSTGLRIVNPGSVGMPYEGEPGAYWALLGPEVEFRRSEYDVVAAMRGQPPPVDDDVLSTLVQPPSSDEATAYFESLRGA